ncbi:carboxypeptidase-like regulatory domain-containing protein [Bacteroides sp. BFG-551]|nr:carboxypeptidase-like regulatory domain-containing protein [Bacteroides sp. BFG-551]
MIKHIEKESEYVFFYYADVFDDSKKTSIRVIDLPVDEILNKLFDGTSVSYEIKDRQILLKKKETAPASKAQQTKGKRLIQGLVKDETGETIIGAAIKVKGTTIGTTTDMDGLYNLSVPSENSVLIVSYIGYVTQEVKVGGRQEYNHYIKGGYKEFGGSCGDSIRNRSEESQYGRLGANHSSCRLEGTRN